MFTAEFSTIVKTQIQPKQPKIDEWVKNISHNGILFCHKKTEIFLQLPEVGEGKWSNFQYQDK